HDSDLEIAAARLTAQEMLPDVATRMQARAEAPRALELEPLIAEIAHARIGILADQYAGADVAAGVLLEVPADRQRAGVKPAPFDHHLLHRAAADDAGRDEARERAHPRVVEAAGRRADHSRDAVAAGEQIGDDRHVETHRPLDHHHGRAPLLLQLQ